LIRSFCAFLSYITYFIYSHISASGTAIDDVTHYIIHRIYNTNLRHLILGLQYVLLLHSGLVKNAVSLVYE